MQRRNFGRFNNDEEIQIRPFQTLHKNSNGEAWYRLSDDEKIPASGTGEETKEIEQIIGLSTRRSVMLGVKYPVNNQNFKSNARNAHNFGSSGKRERKPVYNPGRRPKPQVFSLLF